MGVSTNVLCNGSVSEMRKNKVQMLYDACIQGFRHVLPGETPPPTVISAISAILEGISPVDFGLDPTAVETTVADFKYPVKKKMRFAEKGGVRACWPPPPLTYIHIHECEIFSMGIFCMPAGAVMPPHNHPGMTVLNRLLYGSVHLKSLDLLPSSAISHDLRLMPAELKEERVVKAEEGTFALFPTQGNIHCFTALTDSAILDILTPPYQEDPSYYALRSFFPHAKRRRSNVRETEEKEGKVVFLEEVAMPKYLRVRGKEYSGPEIQVAAP